MIFGNRSRMRRELELVGWNKKGFECDRGPLRPNKVSLCSESLGEVPASLPLPYRSLLCAPSPASA